MTESESDKVYVEQIDLNNVKIVKLKFTRRLRLSFIRTTTYELKNRTFEKTSINLYI